MGTLVSPSLKGVFPKVTLPFYGDVSLGNATMFKVYLAKLPDGYLLCGVVNKGCYPFVGYTHPSYVYEKLNMYHADAANFSDFLNCQLGFSGETGQGSYNNMYCVGYEDEAE